MRVLMVFMVGGFLMSDWSAERASHTPAIPDSNPGIRSLFRDTHFPSMDEVVASAGLHPLKNTSLPSGHRELRIWFGGGLGWPQDMYRFQIKNGSVKGQWFRYWSVAVDSDGPPENAQFPDVLRYDLAGQCDAIRTVDRTAVCIARFTRRPDWKALLMKIESEGVWTLPDEQSLPKEHFPNGMQVIVSDGYGITVEARDGSSYRSYGYDNPETSKQDAAKHAAAITAAFGYLGKFVPPNTHTRIFRGRYTPAPTYYRFINCGDTTTWGLSLSTTPPPMPREQGGDSVSDTIRSAYAEVRGMKAYKGLPKEWDAPYPEIIQSDSVLVLKPWRPEECR